MWRVSTTQTAQASTLEVKARIYTPGIGREWMADEDKHLPDTRSPLFSRCSIHNPRLWVKHCVKCFTNYINSLSSQPQECEPDNKAHFIDETEV